MQLPLIQLLHLTALVAASPLWPPKNKLTLALEGREAREALWPPKNKLTLALEGREAREALWPPKNKLTLALEGRAVAITIPFTKTWCHEHCETGHFDENVKCFPCKLTAGGDDAEKDDEEDTGTPPEPFSTDGEGSTKLSSRGQDENDHDVSSSGKENDADALASVALNGGSSNFGGRLTENGPADRDDRSMKA